MVVPSFSLVRSKLVVPDPAALLHRPRVCETLEQGLERKLTLVSAPAGYGKTSALVDFARHSGVPVCWYTADERDRDLGAFIAYLVGAIEERFRGFGEHTRSALVSFGGELFRDPAAIVDVFVNEILEIGTPFTLVVDNHERLGGAPGVREFTFRLMEVLPSNCHVMLGSRDLPDVPVTQLVAKQQLVGMSDRDLRFDAREIRELLQLSRIEVSEDQVQALAASSEGWITGVLLLANRLQDAAAATFLDLQRATSETYAYLAEDVLERQPPDVQHFLRTSAVLREMSSRLCREVLQIQEPRSLLEELERRSLFVTRFGTGGASTYRYHNLFREFLHDQLLTRDPAQYVKLHLRAAKRFEQGDDVGEAVYHYLTAEAYPEATVLIDQVAREWFTRGRGETLVRWAEALPEERRKGVPWLSYYQSRVLTDRYDYEEALRVLSHAESGFADQGDTARLARVHNQRAMVALLQGRYESAVDEARAALNMLGRDALMERAEARRLVGRACVGLGRLEEGIVELQGALTLFRQVASPYDVVNLLQDLTLAHTSQGRFDQAVVLLNEALVIGRRLGAPTLLAGVLNNLGTLHYVLGKYEKALPLYEEGLVAARQGGDRRWQAYNLVGMADINRDIGAYERARSCYSAAWRFAQASEPGVAVYILTAQADMFRWQSRRTRTLALLREARELAEMRDMDFEVRGLLPVAEGIALAEDGEARRGCKLLSDGIRYLEERQAKRELARACFLLAKAYLLAGDRVQATTTLRRALNLAREIGSNQFAAVEGQHAGELLGLGMAEGVSDCRAVVARIRDLHAHGDTVLEGAGEETEGTGSRLEIYTFGEGRVVRGGHTVSSSEWQAAMPKELFFYILLHGPLERDAIGLVFWPDLAAKRVTDRFHTTLYRVRRAIGQDTVVMDDGRYRLGDVDCWIDVEEFEECIGRARLLPPQDWQAENLWRRAVELYRGDFLSGVDRLWCLPRREALREMYVETLIGVGRCHEARGEFEGAIDWYKRASAADDLREDIHRRIMECYVWAGRRSEALAQYDLCRRTLDREIGVLPSDDTERLYERIAGKHPD